jgi:hypothetical protein
MHPDLYAVVYQQRERELDVELQRRLILQERAGVAIPRRHPVSAAISRLRTKVGHVRGAATTQTAPVCCPA